MNQINFIIIICYTLISSSSFCQVRNDSVYKVNNVSEVIVTRKPHSSSTTILPTKRIINKNGFIIKSYSIDSTELDTLLHYQTYKYDSLGREIKFTTIHNGMIYRTTTSKYFTDSLNILYKIKDTLYARKIVSPKPNVQQLYDDNEVLLSTSKIRFKKNKSIFITKSSKFRRSKTIMKSDLNQNRQAIKVLKIEKSKGEKYIGKTIYYYDSTGLLIKSSYSNSSDNYRTYDWTFYNYKKY